MADFLQIIYDELVQYGMTEIIVTEKNYRQFPMNRLYLTVNWYFQNITMLQISHYNNDRRYTNHFRNNYFRTINDRITQTKIYILNENMDGKSFCALCIGIYQNIKLSRANCKRLRYFKLVYNSRLNICIIHKFNEIKDVDQDGYLLLFDNINYIEEAKQFANLPSPAIKQFLFEISNIQNV